MVIYNQVCYQCQVVIAIFTRSGVIRMKTVFLAALLSICVHHAFLSMWLPYMTNAMDILYHCVEGDYWEYIADSEVYCFF